MWIGLEFEFSHRELKFAPDNTRTVIKDGTENFDKHPFLTTASEASTYQMQSWCSAETGSCIAQEAEGAAEEAAEKAAEAAEEGAKMPQAGESLHWVAGGSAHTRLRSQKWRRRRS